MEKLAEKKKHSKAVKILIVAIPILVVIIVLYVVWAIVAAKPAIRPLTDSQSLKLTIPSKTLSWPAYGQAAIGINNFGVVASNGQSKQVPMASTAKLITALCVLQKYPLAVNQTGPTISLTANDVAIYNKYVAEQGSVLEVTSGEQLSEYQMLEAMLLPSADNIADTLANWAFGSLTNYSAYANTFLKQNGLNNTTVGLDASGYDPSSTSTAIDEVRLGEMIMSNPVLANIVGTPAAGGFPLIGTIKNVNFLLGKDGIIGIKTGNTDQAGGVFLSASKVMVNNQSNTVITAIMQAPTLFDALSSSLPLVSSAQTNFASPTSLTEITKGSVVAEYYVPWSHQTIGATASRPLSVDGWGGSAVKENINVKNISYNTKAGSIVGSINASSSLPEYTGSTEIVLSKTPLKPSIWWTLLHPQSFIHI